MPQHNEPPRSPFRPSDAELEEEARQMMLSHQAVTLAPAIDPVEWVAELPQPKNKKHEFLLDFDWEQSHVYVCVRELFWHETLDIEARSFRVMEDGEMYLAGEYERREILKRAISWVATVPNCEFDSNKDGAILTRLRHEVVEHIWNIYLPVVTLGASEAAALYNASLKYFRGDSQSGHPTPSIIVEVDLMIKFGGMSRKELRRVPTSEMERIQTIFMARSEALGLNGSVRRNFTPVPSETDAKTSEEYDELLPPHIKNMPSGERYLTPGQW